MEKIRNLHFDAVKIKLNQLHDLFINAMDKSCSQI